MKSSLPPERVALCLRNTRRQLKTISKTFIKTIFFLLVSLCLAGSGFGQKISITPYSIGERVTDIPLNQLINYKDSTASLSSFGHKLLILDYWGTHCGSCIKMFPTEDSLQQKFRDKVQFILITSDDSATVNEFLARYNKAHHTKLCMPIVSSDFLITQMFRHSFLPHYVWIAPNGNLLAQTSEAMINESTISAALAAIQTSEAHLKSENFPAAYFHFPRLNDTQSAFFHEHQH